MDTREAHGKASARSTTSSGRFRERLRHPGLLLRREPAHPTALGTRQVCCIPAPWLDWHVCRSSRLASVSLAHGRTEHSLEFLRFFE